MKILKYGLLALLSLFWIAAASAQNGGAFDAKRMSPTEAMYLQTVLAFEGSYQGLIDGQFGRGSLAALGRAIAARPIGQADVAKLLQAHERQYGAERWSFRQSPQTGLSFLAPDEAYLDIQNDAFSQQIKHRTRDVEYILLRGDNFTKNQLHNRILNQGGITGKPYTVRRDARWISSVQTQNGRTTYARSEQYGAEWSTLIVSGSDANAIRPIAGSIRRGQGPDITLQASGYLAGLGVAAPAPTPAPSAQAQKAPQGTSLETVLGLLLQELGQKPPAQQPAPTPAPAPEPAIAATKAARILTGLAVNSGGDVLVMLSDLNACSALGVAGQVAEVKAKYGRFNLALLSTQLRPNSSGLARFSPLSLRPAEDFATARFVNDGFWEELRVERGTVATSEEGGLVQGYVMPLDTVNGYTQTGVVLKRDGSIGGITGRWNDGTRKMVHTNILTLFLTQNEIEHLVHLRDGATYGGDFKSYIERISVPISCQE